MEHIGDITRTLQRDGAKMASGEPTTCRYCGGLLGARGRLIVQVGGHGYECQPWADECPSCCEARERKQLAAMLEAERIRAAKEWRNRSDLGVRLEKALEHYEVAEHNRQAHAKVETWLESPTRNVIIVGPIGCGKSYLAAHAFLRLHQQHAEAWWLSVPRLFAAIKADYAGGGGDSETWTRWATTVPILVLDDLGKAHSHNLNWVEEQLYGIVDARYRDELPCVVTTEYTGSALRGRVGESVITRLEHDALVAGIRQPKTPYRKTKGSAS